MPILPPTSTGEEPISTSDGESIPVLSTFDIVTSINNKQVSFVDLNLVSGSSDLLRQAAGGYFFNEPGTDNQPQVPPPFFKFLPVDNPNDFIYSISSFNGSAVQQEIGNRQARGTAIDPQLGIRQRTILPNVKFITHIEGDPNNEILSDISRGSKYWECLFTGAEFAGDSVVPIYANGTFDDHYFNTRMPYAKIQEQLLVDSGDLDYIQLSNDYNYYLKNYQTFVGQQPSERQIVNFYALAKVAYTSDISKINSNILNYYTMGNSLTQDDINDALMNSPIAPEGTVDGGQYVTAMQNYLNKMPLSSSNISEQALKYVDSRFSNIIFNHNSTRVYLNNPDVFIKSGSMPFYNFLSMPTLASGKVGSFITKNQLSTDFMKSLKEVFLNQSADQLETEPIEFLLNQKLEVPGDGKNYNNKYTASDNTILKSVDLSELILYTHNKIKDDNQDFYIVDGDNLETETAYDTKGTYRAYSARNCLRTLNDISTALYPSAGADGSAFRVDNINLILNSQNDSVYDFNVDNFNTLQPSSKSNEVLAYRVEKIGGPASGDLNTQNVIQNFWVFNAAELKDLKLFDTQIKYDTPYTYKVYAYYCVRGFKYKFSDLQISRIVGSVREDAADLDSPIVGYCVEFFDPETGDLTTDMLEKSVYGDFDDEIISSYATEAQRIAFSEASTTSTGVLPPYLANFITTVQPSFKIIEVPITQKNYRLIDNPPNDINVMPTYALDNSNRIEFDINYETFRFEKFPKNITNDDAQLRLRYLNAKDFISSTPLVDESRSPPERVQIYRLSEKPKSFKDFDGNLYDFVSLKINNSQHSYSSCTFTDVVKSNVTYYYLFRSVNELGVHGDIDVVIEAELVNDGGYKYALFNALFEEDLKQDTFKDKTEKIKNILQLAPNLSQITFDDSEVDYTQTAKSQYNKLVIGNKSNEELIWGETFKIRLTSKKTGKKIDLNITYNDPNVKLEE